MISLNTKYSTLLFLFRIFSHSSLQYRISHQGCHFVFTALMVRSNCAIWKGASHFILRMHHSQMVGHQQRCADKDKDKDKDQDKDKDKKDQDKDKDKDNCAIWKGASHFIPNRMRHSQMVGVASGFLLHQNVWKVIINYFFIQWKGASHFILLRMRLPRRLALPRAFYCTKMC